MDNDDGQRDPDTIEARLTSDGVTGVGEGTPIVRYHESAEDVKKAIDGIIPSLALAGSVFGILRRSRPKSRNKLPAKRPSIRAEYGFVGDR